MQILVVLLGLAIAAAGAWLMIFPAAADGFLKRHAGRAVTHQLAIVSRLVLGVALVSYAHASRFPTVLAILGGISIGAAMVFAILPQRRFEQLVVWSLVRLGPLLRPAGVLVTAFGLFLVYAVV